ncbi:D-alanyl-D-alanine dipeptidase [bacterium BMS3Abin05]|nr:D-alanyl-D-alanine dipeptidase [bacterium BMS3Abin05]GBE26420.1 D-alanyl-D-alanine dipeptidase [bacterium BMS3Bbin03]HDK36420.1 peptidase M15 [Bacteroidota bacterium]HDZ11041.1 peptidase M15 [Bacteroidota bacterium]
MWYQKKNRVAVFSLVVLFFLQYFLYTGCTSQKSEPFVEAASVDSTIIIDLRYATPNNFTGRVLYKIPRCFLRKSVAERLARVQRKLREKGLGLKIWDGYRPLSVQKKMWAIVPDSRYVANPKHGSRHNRGAAVDVTLVDSTGMELHMPTGFDDFSPKAHRDWMGDDSLAIHNRRILEDAMTSEGFIPLSTEWWHFDAPNWKNYPIENSSIRELIRKSERK